MNALRQEPIQSFDAEADISSCKMSIATNLCVLTQS